MVRGSKLAVGSLHSKRTNKTKNRLALAVTTALVGSAGLLTRHASAATYTWSRGIAATFSWDNTPTGSEDAGVNNWNTSPAGAFPAAAGDIANFSNGTSATQFINLDANISIGVLNFANPGNTNTRTIASGTGGAYALTLNNLTADSIISESSSSSAIIAAPVLINGDGNLDISGVYTFASNASNGAPPASVTYPITSGAITFSGGISSSLSSGTQNINVLSGTNIVNSVISNGTSGGTVGISITGGTTTLNSAASNTYTGNTSIGAVTVFPSVIVDFANATVPTNLISSSSTLVMAGGSLNVKQQSGVATSQTFNGLILNPGWSQIAATSVGANGVTLALGAITQSVGGAVDFTLPTTGAITTTNSNVNGILGGWATTGTTVGSAGATSAGDFVAVNASGGIVITPNYTLISSAASSTAATTGTSTQNWKTGSPTNAGNYITTLGGNTVINSLVQSGDINIPSGDTLTVNSGGIILRGNSRWILNNNAGTTTGTAKLTSGLSTGELYVDVPDSEAVNTANWTIWPTIIDGSVPTTFYKTGPGLLKLGNYDTFTGGTVVDGGTLQLLEGGGTGTLRGTLTINPGATVTTSAANALGYNAGLYVNVVNINGGLMNDTAVGDQAYNTVWNLSGGTMQSNLGVSSATATSYFVIDGAASVVNVIPNVNPSVIAGRVYSRDTNVTTYNVATGSASPNLLVSAAITGTYNYIKSGAGIMQLTGNNTYTGTTTIAAGILLNTGQITATSLLSIGSVNGNAAEYLQSGTSSTLATTGVTAIGSTPGGFGYFNLPSGTVNLNAEIDPGGNTGGAGTFGQLDVAAGAVMNLSATSGNCYFLPNRGAAGETSVVNIAGTVQVSGGTLVTDNTFNGLTANWASTGAAQTTAITIPTGGQFLTPSLLTRLNTGSSYNGLTGNSANVTALNLDGGTLQTRGFSNGVGNNGNVQINFNGGTLRAGNASNASYLANLGAVYIYSGGATIDDNGQAITIAQPLLTPAGSNGVLTIPVTSGGSGYLVPPEVTITGGTGATAYAVLSNGVVSSIVVTNPGTGFSGTPSVSLTTNANFTGTAATVGTATTVANVGGGLTKLGAGTLTLSGQGTYTGATNVSAGTIAAGASSTISSGPFGFGSAMTLGSSANLNVAGFNASVGSLAGGGSVALGVGNLNITGTGTTPLAYTGAVTGSAGSSISVGNTGTLTLGSASTVTTAYVATLPGGTLNLLGGSSISNLSNGGFTNLSTATTLSYLNGPSTGLLNTNGQNLTVATGGTYGGSIADGNTSGGSLTLNAGTLNLSGASLFTGPTTINAGTLVLDHSGTNTGALGNTAVSVPSTLLVKGNATIGGTGLAGNSSLGSLSTSGVVSLQDLTINTLTVAGPLSLTAGPSLKFDLGTSAADEILTGGVANPSATAIYLNLLAGQTIVPGSYTLITATGGLPVGGTGFTIVAKPAGFYNFSLGTSTSTATILSITGNAVVSGSEYWTGLASVTGGDTHNNWGTGSAFSVQQSNWSTNAAGTSDALQVPGSSTDVVFTANNATQSTAGVLTTQMDAPYSIKGLTFAVPTTGTAAAITSTVIGTNTYGLTIGTDGLTVASTTNAGVLINGTGSVVLNGSQSWADNSSLTLNVSTGISAVSAGTTLTLNGTGTGAVTLGPITNGTGGIALVFGETGNTTLIGNNSISGSFTVNSGTVTSNGSNAFASLAVNGGALTLGGAVTDTGGVLVNNGTLQLNGNNAISGGVVINGGLVQLGNAGALNSTSPNTLAFGSTSGDLQLVGNSVAVNNLTAGSSGPIVEDAGTSNATLTDNLSGSTTYAGVLQDGIGGGIFSLNVTGAGVLALTGSNTYSGGTTVAGGAKVQISAANNLGSTTAATNTVTLNNSTLEVTSGSPTLTPTQAFTLAGPATIQTDGGTLTVQGNVATGTSTLLLNGAGNVNLSGNITGGGSLNVNSAGGTVTLNGSNTYTGTTIVNNNALLQITAGTTGTTGTAGVNNVQLATATGQTATLNVSGGTLSADRFIIGGNTNNTDGGTATVNQTGGIINSAQWFSVGSGGGTSTATGVYNLSGNGVLNVNSANGTNMEVGNFAGTNGTVNMSGNSTINIYNNGSIRLLSNSAVTGYFYQNGGNVNFYSDAGVTNGGTGSLVVGQAGTGTAYYLLNGGTLSVPSVTHNAGTGVFEFNGGVLQTESSSATFMKGLNNAFVENNGAIINVPAGFTPTIPQPLVHDNNASNAIDGGLTVTGAGTLSLSNNSTYTGPTVISGSLRLLGSGLTVNNLGSGGSGMNAVLNSNGGTGTISTAGALAGTGSLVLPGNGSILDVNSGVTSLNNTSTWTISVWVKTNQPGFTILNKGTPGTNWTTGNSTFYLGVPAQTGTNSGGTPVGVRYAGGWLSGSTTTVHNGTWNLVTYTDDGTTETVYVNGVADTTTQGMTNADVGTHIRFGVAGTGEGDGTAIANGSIGAINIYGTNLTASQVASLYTANSAVGATPILAINFAGSTLEASTNNILPSGTPVTLTSNTAVLDVEAVNQTVASLNSNQSGSSLILGQGSTLTVLNTTNSEFDGSVTGTGSISEPNAGTFNLGGGTITYSGTTSVGSGAVLNFGAFNNGTGVVARTIGPVTISSGGQINLQHAASHSTRQVLAVPGLTLGGGTGSWSSLLDLSDNDLVVQGVGSTGLATITNQVQQGYSGGTWQGSGGITSSAAAARSSHLTALGVIQNDNGTNTATALYSTFDGVPVTDADVLVKYTYYGDTNLDGQVDGTDYSRIDNGYLNSLTGWFNGDFNYDGVIDGSDYTLIDNAFNTQGASLAAQTATATAQVAAGSTGSSAVPEPATLGLLGMGAVGLLGRRRRRSDV